MQWSELFNNEREPTAHQIKEFVNTLLWDELTDYLQQTCKVQPKMFYSCCSMQSGVWKGWNIKYKKNGRSLCTLYPKQGYFIALIPVGKKEAAEADFLIPQCDNYTQNLYKQTEAGINGKSLPMKVTSENILCDVKSLIALRAGARKK